MALGVEVLLCHQPDAVTGGSLEQRRGGGPGGGSEGSGCISSYSMSSPALGHFLSDSHSCLAISSDM